MGRFDRVVTASAALIIAVLGFLPIANWIPGSNQILDYGDSLTDWLSGTAIACGLAVVVVLGARKFPALPGEELRSYLVALYLRAPKAWPVGLAVVSGAVYLWIAGAAFARKPLFIDEISQVFQARVFADGALWAPVREFPEFFSMSLVLNLDGKAFSQFPPGGPAMLALGTLAGGEWIVGPVFGALSVLFFSLLVRHIEPRPGIGLAATLLFAFAPFVVFMSGSHMNHVPALAWLLLGMLGLARVIERPAPGIRDGLLLGLGFGIAGTIRPIDAFAFAVPAGVWLLFRTVRTKGWAVLAAAGVGVAVPLAGMFVFNALTTGSALTFGYVALWGKAHDVGFHTSPWGGIHTPARGLELLNLYFFRLQSYLFETPIPSLTPVVVALGLRRGLLPFDRYLFATTGILAGSYFAYWHDGLYLGPRFMFPLVPFLVLWTARIFSAFDEVGGRRLLVRGVAVAALTSVVIALTISIPLRLDRHENNRLTMRWNADEAARAAGVVRALVFVRESWGSQLMARMWAAGIPPGEADYQYLTSDACALEQAVDRVEQRGLRGPAALAELTPLLRDSSRLVRSPFSVDQTTKFLPGSIYTGECIQRLAQDGQGFTLFGPLALAGKRDDVIYARDLHARDSLLLREYPGRAVYLLRPTSTEVGAEPEFFPLRRDSLLDAWRRGR